MSSVVELRENIVDKVIELGVCLDFLENPAFITALSEINGLIEEMNIEDPSVILVDKSKGYHSFSYINPNGDKYKLGISCPDERTVKCVRELETRSFEGGDGHVVRHKAVIEQLAKYGDHGEVIIITNTGSVDNICCDNHHYNMNNSVERRVYTKRGVMYEREHKVYATRKGEGYFHRVGAKEMLLLARQAFDYGPWSDTYNRRTLLRREMLDTARLVYENRGNESNYYGVVPLHKGNSLKDLVIDGEYNKYPMKDVEIPALTEGEVAELLARETDEKIAEGLGFFAQGRTTYTYKSVENEA